MHKHFLPTFVLTIAAASAGLAQAAAPFSTSGMTLCMFDNVWHVIKP